MKQAKKNKEYKLEMIQVRELVYRFTDASHNTHQLVLTKDMTQEERQKAFILAIRT